MAILAVHFMWQNADLMVFLLILRWEMISWLEFEGLLVGLRHHPRTSAEVACHHDYRLRSWTA